MTFISDVWKSFLAMPLWVKVWVFLILVPVNVASLWFIGHPGSVLIASLAIAGMAFNAIPIWFDRGFTTTMAIPHVIFWVPLVAVLIYYLLVSPTVLSDSYRYYLIALLVCDVFSLVFDIPDTFKWFKAREKTV